MENVEGGIRIPDSPTITDEHKKLVEEARKGLVDSSKVTPFSLLGTQVVAGTNYWFLCKSQQLSGRGAEKLVVYKINRDLQNKVTLLDVKDFQF